MRDGDPPGAWFIVDELSLHRLVGSPEIMATQMRYLLSVAAMPRVTVQVLPAVAHPAGSSGFLLADESAWVEHVVGGFVYTGETVSSLSRLFNSLRGEIPRVGVGSPVGKDVRAMGDWRKSSYSNANGGDCVEVADKAGAILVRDTKNRAGTTLSVDADARGNDSRRRSGRRLSPERPPGG
jgi:hypothetical protein